MTSDVVLPKGNEKAFIEIALRLGIRCLYFLYDLATYKDFDLSHLNSTLKNKLELKLGFMVDQSNPLKPMPKILENSRFVVAKSSVNDIVLVKSKKVRVIYGFEDVERGDYLNQRASRLNHVLCKEAMVNKVSVGFSYSSLLNNNDAKTQLIMGRMMQNINLCRKYKVKMLIGSFSSNPFELRAAHDIAKLFSLFGATIDKIKDAQEY